MKILIYMPKDKLKPIGGPAGYLYNLNIGLEEIGASEVDFLPETGENEHTLLKSIYHSMPYKFRNCIGNIYKSCKQRVMTEEKQDEIAYYNFNNLLNGKSFLPDDYLEYDVIHFHTTFELYKERKALENYEGKVVLNSHSPQPNHQEYITFFNNHPRRDEILKELVKADTFAFDRADVILFPCQEAEEPYYNNWDEYKLIHERNSEKYKYIITGIKQCSVKVSRKEVRKKYGIPEEAFVVCYIGRHNEIKGYEWLKTIGEKIINNDKDIYFLIAGKEGPIMGLKNKNWIEVGWTDDPHSIMGAADVFVLPNKETYFDLIMLEVLSLGMPVIASYTGGNKYFEDKSDGICLFKDEESFVQQVHDMKDNRLELSKYMQNNKDFFVNNLDEKIFANNYISLMRGIIDEKK